MSTILSQAREKVQQKLNPSAPKPPAAVSAGQPAASRTRSQRVTRAAIFNATKTTQRVEFDFNPETIKIGHAPDTKPLNRSMGKAGETKSAQVLVSSQNEVIVNAGEATIAFGDLVFEGAQTAANCAQLLAWSYPVDDRNPDPTPGKLPTNKAGASVAPPTHGLAGKGGGGKTPPAPMVLPLLTFSWLNFEPGIKGQSTPPNQVNIVLARVDVTYSRFGADGKPYRARVALTCKIPPQKLEGTNPTSGGRPDRRGHVVTAGEDLPGIARQNYGRAGYWRDLAELNGIDDPLRVRPGDRLYVPGFAELRDGPA